MIGLELTVQEMKKKKKEVKLIESYNPPITPNSRNKVKYDETHHH